MNSEGVCVCAFLWQCWTHVFFTYILYLYPLCDKIYIYSTCIIVIRWKYCNQRCTRKLSALPPHRQFICFLVCFWFPYLQMCESFFPGGGRCVKAEGRLWMAPAHLTSSPASEYWNIEMITCGQDTQGHRRSLLLCTWWPSKSSSVEDS